MTNLLPEDVRSDVERWLGPDVRVEPLFGDASVRAYYRIVTASGERFVLGYYPEAVRESLMRFARAHDALASTSIVPRVVKRCNVALLQQDVGDETLFEVLGRDRDEGISFYRRAIELLPRFQDAAAEGAAINPPFDAPFFLAELRMTGEFWVERLCGAAHTSELDSIFANLAQKISMHPQVLCHRDYHGQNIHVHNDALYVIDYQDMRKGPDTYDLASLLRDRGVARILGEKVERELVAHYEEITGSDAALFDRYLETLLQRSIKIVGTFAKLAVARGRTHYLDFIPAALESIRFCVERLPEFRPLHNLFPFERTSK